MQRLIEQTKKILARREKYQPGMTALEREDLYIKLLREEKHEYEKAMRENNIIEKYDAIIDMYRVDTIYLHAQGESVEYIVALRETNLGGVYNIPYDLFCDLLDEVLKSNFSKSLEQEKTGEKKGKIIKGENYVEPDIEGVLRRHGLL